jgi:hypothetical protein
VNVGLVQGEETQVTGLSTTSRVIVQGQNNVLDGALIKVVTPGAKA